MLSDDGGVTFPLKEDFDHQRLFFGHPLVEGPGSEARDHEAPLVLADIAEPPPVPPPPLTTEAEDTAIAVPPALDTTAGGQEELAVDAPPGPVPGPLGKTWPADDELGVPEWIELNDGDVMVNTIRIRKYKGSTRPKFITPGVWQLMNTQERAKAMNNWGKYKERYMKALPPGTVPVAVCVGRSAHGGAPAMPVSVQRPVHRPRIPDVEFPFPVAVARSVGKREVAENPQALEAVLKEWDKLRKAGAWDESNPREWSEVAAEARANGATAHVGRIFEICVEKNAELPAGHPNRKFKGRVVFQGNNVKDENWDAGRALPAAFFRARGNGCCQIRRCVRTVSRPRRGAIGRRTGVHTVQAGGRPHLGSSSPGALATFVASHA